MSTFHRFPDLPYDVRSLVWQWSLASDPKNPRIVNIGARVDLACPKGQWHLYSKTPAPALLSTCHESRRVALGHYHPAFRCSDKKHADYTIWVNFETDIVRFPIEDVGCGWHADNDLIQRLHLMGDAHAASDFIRCSLGELEFDSLKTVDIYHQDDVALWNDAAAKPSWSSNRGGSDTTFRVRYWRR